MKAVIFLWWYKKGAQDLFVRQEERGMVLGETFHIENFFKLFGSFLQINAHILSWCSKYYSFHGK